MDEERNKAKDLRISLDKRNISITCSEETLIERGIIPSISLEASTMASNKSPSVILKGEKSKRLMILNTKQNKQGESSSYTI